MKKLFFMGFALVALGLTSCGKDYSCNCGGLEMATIENALSKSQATDSCNDFAEDLSLSGCTVSPK